MVLETQLKPMSRQQGRKWCTGFLPQIRDMPPFLGCMDCHKDEAIAGDITSLWLALCTWPGRSAGRRQEKQPPEKWWSPGVLAVPPSLSCGAEAGSPLPIGSPIPPSPARYSFQKLTGLISLSLLLAGAKGVHVCASSPCQEPQG